MVEADWEEVKPKKKRAKPQQQQQPGTGGIGGKNSKGMLIPGAVIQKGKTGAAAAAGSGAASGAMWDETKMAPTNQASAIADQDFGIDEDGELEAVNVEMISHTCAMSVKNARIQAQMTQAQLAKKINEKTSVINEVEMGNYKYSAELINRIERATNCKIDRGRKKRRK